MLGPDGGEVDRRHLANLIIAGVSKAGTTSLFWWLAQHPAICRSDVKEVWYFSPIRHGDPLPPLAEYAAHFRHWAGEPYRLEASPGYGYGGRSTAEVVDHVLDDPKVIICLRDPVDRFLSFHSFMRSRLAIPEDMDVRGYLHRCEEMARAGEDRQRGNFPYFALTTGAYADFLTGWFDVFGPRLRIVFFDDLSTDPVGALRGLTDWLGIDGSVVETFDLTPENRTVPIRSATMQRLALAANRRFRRFFSDHRLLKRRLRGIYQTINADRADGGRRRASDEERAMLRERYAGANERLAQLLRANGYTDLPSWVPAGVTAEDVVGAADQP